MKIAIDLGNKYVKAQTETGEQAIFYPVIASAPARQKVFSTVKKAGPLMDSIQVALGSGEKARNYYVGKLAERSGELPERVFGKDKYTTDSAERLIWTTLGLLVKDNEPVDLVLDFPYGQFGKVKDQFAKRLQGKTEQVAVQGRGARTITIQSVTEHPQSLVAVNVLKKMYPEAFADDDGGYLAIADIGGDTTDVVVVEMVDGEIVVHDEISGTLLHGTRDLTQTIRRRMENETGDVIDTDLADRLIEKGKAFYGDRTWSFPAEVAYSTSNLAALLRSQIADLLGTGKNRVRAMFWIGGGAPLLKEHLQGFHFQDIFPENAQWKNVEGCLLADAGTSTTDQLTPTQETMAHTESQTATQPPREQTATHETDRTEEQQNHHQQVADSSPSPHQQPHHAQQQPSSPREEGRQGGQASSSTATNVPKRFQEGASAWQNA